MQRRPWPAAIICLFVLLALAAPARHMHFGFPDAGNDPTSFTTRRAYDLLSEGFGRASTARCCSSPPPTARTPRPRSRPSPPRWRPTPTSRSSGPPVSSPDGKVALRGRLSEVVAAGRRPRRTSSSDSATTSCPRPRRAPASPCSSVVPPATSVDATSYVVDRLGVFIGVVIVLSFLLLLVVFRSLLVPLKAAIMNLLSVGAAYGVVAMVVQGGWFGGLVGIHDPVPIPSFIPMMMFAILFGLSMDYEVFLLSRIREEYARTGDNADRGRRRARRTRPG